MSEVSFFVPGTARPYSKRISKKRLIPTSKLAAPWADAVYWYAFKAMAGRDPFGGPISMLTVFFLAGGRKRKWMARVPDDDNLAYLVSNVLSGIGYQDDRLRVDLRITKRINHDIEPGLYVEIKQLSEYPDDWEEHLYNAQEMIRKQEREDRR